MIHPARARELPIPKEFGCRLSILTPRPHTLLFNLRIREPVEVARRTAGRKQTDEEIEHFSLKDPQ